MVIDSFLLWRVWLWFVYLSVFSSFPVDEVRSGNVAGGGRKEGRVAGWLIDGIAKA